MLELFFWTSLTVLFAPKAISTMGRFFASLYGFVALFSAAVFLWRFIQLDSDLGLKILVTVLAPPVLYLFVIRRLSTRLLSTERVLHGNLADLLSELCTDKPYQILALRTYVNEDGDFMVMARKAVSPFTGASYNYYLRTDSECTTCTFKEALGDLETRFPHKYTGLHKSFVDQIPESGGAPLAIKFFNSRGTDTNYQVVRMDHLVVGKFDPDKFVVDCGHSRQ